MYGQAGEAGLRLRSLGLIIGSSLELGKQNRAVKDFRRAVSWCCARNLVGIAVGAIGNCCRARYADQPISWASTEVGRDESRSRTGPVRKTQAPRTVRVAGVLANLNDAVFANPQTASVFTTDVGNRCLHSAFVGTHRCKLATCVSRQR